MPSRQTEVEAKLSRAEQELSQKAQEVEHLKEELRVEVERTRKKRMYDEFMEKPTTGNEASAENNYLPAALDRIIKELERTLYCVQTGIDLYKTFKKDLEDLIASPAKPLPLHLFTDEELNTFSALKKHVENVKNWVVWLPHFAHPSIKRKLGDMAKKTRKYRESHSGAADALSIGDKKVKI